MPVRIGLISDTHGLLRPVALAFLEGSARIVHAGDICDPGALERLGRIAPVTAVRGNNDRGEWAERLDEIERLAVEGVRLLVIHDLAELPAAALTTADVIVAGHSHRPSVERRGGVLFVNPGSAGPRRFKLPISAAELIVDGGEARAHIVCFDAA